MPEAPAARPRVGSLSNNSSGNRTSLFSSFLGKPATPKQERPQSAGGRQQQQQPQQQQPQQPVQSGANEFGAAPRQSMQPEPQPLHGELKSAVNLTQSHARKVYFSGPMVQRIERGSDGNRPAKDEGWKDVWAQLSGTTFSVWDMRAIEEASRQNREVPPKYINITDAFFHVLGAVTIPASETTPAQTYSNVLTLNTAGANLFLFSAPNPAALISWVSAFRLASWEKSRLEEIYTAHLIRVTLPQGKDVPSGLVKGRMEGWVRVRVSGQTDWKKLWMVISVGVPSSSDPMIHQGGVGEDGTMSQRSASPNTLKKSKVGSVRATMSMFGKSKAPQGSFAAAADKPLPVRSEVAFYAAPTPVKNMAPVLGPPVITVVGVHQAFAVYPERPELITKSTLIKMEGSVINSDGSIAEGWVMIMPEISPGDTRTKPQEELLKYIVAVHDAFGLYGRGGNSAGVTGGSYTWDPRDPASLMFGYPVGPQKDMLFLDREASEQLDPRDDRTRAIRSNFLGILMEKMRIAGTPVSPNAHANGAPQLPQIGGLQDRAPLDAIAELDSPVSTMAGGRSGSGGAFGFGNGASGGSNMSKDTTPGAAGIGSGMGTHGLGPMVGSPEAIEEEPSNPMEHREPVHGRAGVLNRGLTDSPTPETQGDREKAVPPPPQAEMQPAPAPISQARPSNEYSPSKALPGPNRYSTDRERAPVPVAQQAPVQPRSQSPLSPNRISTSSAGRPSSPLSAGSVASSSRIAPLKPIQSNRPNISTAVSPTSALSKAEQPPMSATKEGSLFDEAGAMYYMQHMSDGESQGGQGKRLPAAVSEGTESLASIEKPTVKRNHTIASINGPDPMYSAQQPPMPRATAGTAGPRTLAHESMQDSADAMAALSYLDQDHESPVKTNPTTSPMSRPPVDRAEDRSPDENGNGHMPNKSSFAPSKQAAERKARSQAQQADRHEAAHKPGRVGKKKTAKDRGAWGSSEEEEEDEEEEGDSDDEVASNGPKTRAATQRPVQQQQPSQQQQQQQPPPQQSQHQPPMSAPTPVRPLQTRMDSPDPQRRMTRNLPQPPPGGNNGLMRPPDMIDHPDPRQRRTPSEQYPSEPHSARQTYHDGQTQLRMQSEHHQPGAARQNMWSQVLEPGKNANDFENNRNTFVQVEPQSEMMTKAFTPHGLLSAGLQDKQDRSAKEQEKMARETGASLINVPHKPPPPQTGLLGAITAHERERKREGGMGATLTDREREKRNAEERQRLIDEHQKNQLEMMQNGSQYGGQFNPMAMNPMMNPMMAMNPYMMGMMSPGMMSPGMMSPGMGGQFPPQPAFNPAHMYAAQAAAAAAYQQAMYAFSQAGSVVGGDNDAPANSHPTSPPMHPMMSGNGSQFAQSPMMMDPRYSYFQPGMGMGMGIPQQHSGSGQMQMQHSGGQFDARFPPTNLQPPGPVGQNSGPTSRNSSPGVPAASPRSYDQQHTKPQ